MKLSNRLTRAGIVFIMLGTTATLLPEAGTALAETAQCKTTGFYRLTIDSSFSDSNSPYTVDNGSSLTFYAASSPDGSTYSSTTAAYTLTPGTAGSLSNTSGTSTAFTRASGGSETLTATFGDGTQIPVTIN